MTSMTWLLYAVPFFAAVFMGFALWRHKDPPGVAYVAFVSAAGALLIVIAVDTKWYTKLPKATVGGQMTSLDDPEETQRASLGKAIERLQQEQSLIANKVGVPTSGVPRSDLCAFGRIIKCVPAGRCTGPSGRGLGFAIDLASDEAMENSCWRACRTYARDYPNAYDRCETA
jgi:hypothetical protein